MASPNEPWTLAGGKKNKPQNTHASSKGKKKTFAENMPRIEPSRKLLSDLLVVGVSHNERYAALSWETCRTLYDIFENRDRSWCALIVVITGVFHLPEKWRFTQ